MARLSPNDRVGMFTQRLTELCAEADLPKFDRVVHEPQADALIFLWEHPAFCAMVSPSTSSIFGMGADELRSAWERKHGGDWRARLARGAIRRERPGSPVPRPRRNAA